MVEEERRVRAQLRAACWYERDMVGGGGWII